MNQYEITFITKENLKGEPAKKEIESLSGKILSINSLEDRQFAYPIKKENSGTYSTIVFELAPEKVFELNKKLALDTEILRHLIITYKAASVPTKPKVIEKTLAEPAETELAAPVETEIIPKEEPKETEVKPEEPEQAPVEEAKEKKAAKKPTKKAPEKIEKPKPAPEPSKASQEAMKEELSAEDRLKALDKKLDELLKE